MKNRNCWPRFQVWVCRHYRWVEAELGRRDHRMSDHHWQRIIETVSRLYAANGKLHQLGNENKLSCRKKMQIERLFYSAS